MGGRFFMLSGKRNKKSFLFSNQGSGYSSGISSDGFFWENNFKGGCFFDLA